MSDTDQSVTADEIPIEGAQDEQTQQGPQEKPSPYFNDLNDNQDGKIFVGGLDYNVTEPEMREYFEKYGSVTSVQIMIDRNTFRSRGFGFVTMEHPEAADIVVVNTHTVGGKQVEVKKATRPDARKEGGNFGNSAPQNQLESSKIFVGGLHPDATEQDLNTEFSNYGQVTDTMIMRDRNTSISRGFGFVTFAESSSVVSLV